MADNPEEKDSGTATMTSTKAVAHDNRVVPTVQRRTAWWRKTTGWSSWTSTASSSPTPTTLHRAPLVGALVTATRFSVAGRQRPSVWSHSHSDGHGNDDYDYYYEEEEEDTHLKIVQEDNSSTAQTGNESAADDQI
nr:hypothetical protein BaRGS_008035 [Batillaria attramentaria]